MAKYTEKELFESVSVPKAVAALAIPTIISQVVTMVYNLADTFFIGQIGDPYIVAAVSLAAPWFNLLTALGNLFGVGGSSLISRMLGRKQEDRVKYVSAFSIWGGGIVTLCFSIITYLEQTPILHFLGASSATMAYAKNYLFWVVTVGGVPTMVSLSLGHFLRSEGYAKPASIGMMFGGILNVILDPVLIFGLGMGVTGAAVATAFSNTMSVLFFVVQYVRFRGRTAVSLNPRYFTFRYVRQICSVGLASAFATSLGNVANMVIVKLAAAYGDIPLAAYYKRMRHVSVFSWKTAVVISACFVAGYAAFAPQILVLFIRERETSTLGAVFLRIACLAVPLTSANFLISYTLQAMGKGTQSAALTFCRQGLLNIPLLLVMDRIFGLYGMIWTQLGTEVIMLPVSIGMYWATFRKLRTEKTR